MNYYRDDKLNYGYPFILSQAIFFDLRQIDHGYRTQSQVNQ